MAARQVIQNSNANSISEGVLNDGFKVREREGKDTEEGIDCRRL